MSQEKFTFKHQAERVGNEMIKHIEECIALNVQPKWKRGWAIKAPMNPVTKTVYKGWNYFSLMFSGFTSNLWFTFNNVTQSGGKVKKGSKGQEIFFWSFNKIGKNVTQADGSDKMVMRTVPLVRVFTVFNLDQCDFPAEVMEKFEVKIYTLTGSDLKWKEW